MLLEGVAKALARGVIERRADERSIDLLDREEEFGVALREQRANFGGLRLRRK